MHRTGARQFLSRCPAMDYWFSSATGCIIPTLQLSLLIAFSLKHLLLNDDILGLDPLNPPVAPYNDRMTIALVAEKSVLH